MNFGRLLVKFNCQFRINCQKLFNQLAQGHYRSPDIVEHRHQQTGSLRHRRLRHLLTYRIKKTGRDGRKEDPRSGLRGRHIIVEEGTFISMGHPPIWCDSTKNAPRRPENWWKTGHLRCSWCQYIDVLVVQKSRLKTVETPSAASRCSVGEQDFDIFERAAGEKVPLGYCRVSLFI